MNYPKFVGWFFLLLGINAAIGTALYFLGQLDSRVLLILLAIELVLFAIWWWKFFAILNVLSVRENALVILTGKGETNLLKRWFNHATGWLYEIAARIVDNGNYNKKSVTIHCYIISNVILITAAMFFEQLYNNWSSFLCVAFLSASVAIIGYTAEKKAVMLPPPPPSND